MKALVVDPDPVAARFCRGTLEQAGFAVRSVESGVLALVAAREMVPDIILLATQLRDVPGGEVAAWLKADPLLRDRPVVMLGPDCAPAAYRGAFLRKPLSAAAITRAVEEAVKS